MGSEMELMGICLTKGRKRRINFFSYSNIKILFFLEKLAINQFFHTCFFICDDEAEEAAVLALDRLGVMPMFSPRKIELTTKM